MNTIIETIEKSCQKHQQLPAIQHKVAGNWSGFDYQELQTTYKQVATGLLASGFSHGDHAAIIAPSSPRWISAYLGTLRAGGIVVPIDKELKSSELRHILEDSDATVLFTTRNHVELLYEVVGELSALKNIIILDETDTEKRARPALPDLLRGLANHWHHICRSSTIPTGEKSTFSAKLQAACDEASLLSPEAAPSPFIGQKELMELHEKGLLIPFHQFLNEDELPPYNEQPDTTAVILYTSGTTGRSKGAMLSHANITWNITHAIDLFQLRDRKIRTLSFLPINHVFEQVCGIMLPLSLGGTVFFAESLKKLGDNINELKPTFFLGVPAVYKLLGDRILKSINSKRLSRALFSIPLTRKIVTGKIQKKIGKDTILVSGGAALDPSVSSIFTNFGLQLFQGYGITETSPVISAESFNQRKPGTVGKALKGVSIRIDEANDEGVGEICVSGHNVMQGYYKNKQATDEVLQNGWYKTGDLGYLDKDGYLTISGRVKNLIVTPNGKNVYPEEVEAELLESPFIAEIMVYGHKVDALAEEVHAVIFPDQDYLDTYAKQKGLAVLNQSDVDGMIKQEVLKHGKNLADYKRIKKFTLREDEFPKTTTRKIKRFAVGAEISAGS